MYGQEAHENITIAVVAPKITVKNVEAYKDKNKILCDNSPKGANKG